MNILADENIREPIFSTLDYRYYVSRRPMAENVP